MKKSFLNFCGTLVATAALFVILPNSNSQAASSLVPQYKTALSNALQNTRGSQSINKTGSILGSYTNKQYTSAPQFSSNGKGQLFQHIKASQKSTAMVRLFQKMTSNYFKSMWSKTRLYNPQSSTYQRSLAIIISSIPYGQRNSSVYNQLISAVASVNSIYGGSTDQLQTLEATIKSYFPSNVS